MTVDIYSWASLWLLCWIYVYVAEYAQFLTECFHFIATNDNIRKEKLRTRLVILTITCPKLKRHINTSYHSCYCWFRFNKVTTKAFITKSRWLDVRRWVEFSTQMCPSEVFEPALCVRQNTKSWKNVKWKCEKRHFIKVMRIQNKFPKGQTGNDRFCVELLFVCWFNWSSWTALCTY